MSHLGVVAVSSPGAAWSCVVAVSWRCKVLLVDLSVSIPLGQADPMSSDGEASLPEHMAWGINSDTERWSQVNLHLPPVQSAVLQLPWHRGTG